ncbi:MAG: Fe-S-containing hydro-lyase [Bacillota bacterium]
MEKRIETPLTDEVLQSLKAGDKVLIDGVIYTGRDSAHGRLVETMERGEELPVDFTGQIIYYVGPCPAKPGDPIGSAGPTTSGRMDAYTPAMLEVGLKGMIGKGNRSGEVVEAIKKYGAVYLLAMGGAGALLAKCVRKAEVVAYEELGPEAIYRLEVEDFPVVVGIDTEGNDIYVEGRKAYAR